MTRDEAVARLLAGAVAAGAHDGAGTPGPVDLDAATAEMTFDDVTYVVTVEARP